MQSTGGGQCGGKEQSNEQPHQLLSAADETTKQTVKSFNQEMDR